MIGESMKIVESIQGAYGEVSVSVEAHGMPKGIVATPEGVAELVEAVLSRFHSQLESLHQPVADGTVCYSEPNGYEYEGMIVKVQSNAIFQGKIGLRSARAYIGHLSESLTELLVEYLDDQDGSFHSELEHLMPELV